MILQELKKKSIELRKAKSELASFSVFLIAEIEKVGKNDGNRETTNDEAIKVLQKMVKNLTGVPGSEGEIAFIEDYLPQQVSEEELREFIVTLNAGNIGAVMGAVKKHYGATADMKVASKIAKEVLG